MGFVRLAMTVSVALVCLSSWASLLHTEMIGFRRLMPVGGLSPHITFVSLSLLSGVSSL